VSTWIEVPSHRVLKVTHEEFERDFVRYNPDGNICGQYDITYRIYRKSDLMQFIEPRFHHRIEDCGNIVFLEPYFG
jgi:hypothetical protein